MKQIIQNIFTCIPSLLFVIIFGTTASGQSTNPPSMPATDNETVATQSDKSDVTISFKVYGVCGDCKKRIESTALDVKGVKKAEWDMKTDMLVLVGSAKMDKQKVADALAKAGHKSELAAADEKGYKNLPACCQYDGDPKKH